MNRSAMVLGISASMWAKNKEFLTEPYISRSKNGSGIGLAVVKKIMQDHNGNIELENNKNNKGAKVSLLFPLN